MPPPSHRPLAGHGRPSSTTSPSLLAGGGQGGTGADAPSTSSTSGPSSAAHSRQASSSSLAVHARSETGSSGGASNGKLPGESTRKELQLALRKIKLLSSFPRALSPTLPPSPPASRSPSPAPDGTHTRTATHNSSSVNSDAPSAGASPADAGRAMPSPPSEADVPSGGKRKRRHSASTEGDDAAERARVKALRRTKVSEAQWSVDKYKSVAHSYRERARALKHRADARGRTSSSSSAAPPPALVFLTELTDSILLWVYAFWADDQISPGRVNVEMWRSLDGMKKVVRAGWEGVVKAGEADSSKAGRRTMRRVRAMLGLVYLVDALVLLHTTTYAQSSLHNRTLRLQQAAHAPHHPARPGGAGGSSSSSKPTNGGSSLAADSPASLASSSADSPSSSADPSTAAPAMAISSLPSDYLPQVLGLTANLTRALRLHGTAAALLPPRDLARDFPTTWARAHPYLSNGGDREGSSSDESDSDEDAHTLLTFSPASPHLVDPDQPALGWSHPIALSSVPALQGIPGVPSLPPSAGGAAAGGPMGMGGMLPHLVVFGRSLLEEWARGRAREDHELKGWAYDLSQGWVEPLANSRA